ncbi:MAG: sulfotransferase family 2 domain-containing protein [Acidobacteria bacterium]|nr:sulfotransferase family 2 domain-containing protein [Acidobacteriota bacterium]
MPDSIEHVLTPEDQLVFVHIPKTAGLTVRAILSNRFDYGACYPRSNEWWWVGKESPGTLDHYRLFNGHFPYCVGELLSRPLFFTMLREPVDRLASQFNYVRRSPSTPIHEFISESGLTLEEFLTNPVTANGLRDWQSGFIGSVGFGELCRIHKALTEIETERRDPGGTHYPNLGIAVAKERLGSFAMFGLSERFDESLMLLDYTFGWKPTRNYQSFNRRADRERREELSAKAIDAALALSCDDVELYAFAARLFDERFTAMCHDLLERYGGARHAVRSGPLDGESLVELLEAHYKKRAIERDDGPRTTWVWPPGAAAVGNGWHAAEEFGDGRCARWSGPGTVSTLDALLRCGTDYRVEFDILCVLEPSLLDTVSLAVDGESIALERISSSSAEGHRFRGVVSASVVGETDRIVTLAWKVGRTMKPSEVDPSNFDPRWLGLCFGGVSLTSVGSEG